MKTRHHLGESKAASRQTVLGQWYSFTKFATLAVAAIAWSPAFAAPTPTQQAYLKASNTGARDEFGWSVAVLGDTAVIGARFESSSAAGVNGNQTDDTAPQSGAAYILVRNASSWGQQAYLKASNPGGASSGGEFGDSFGWSVAVSGDTVVVGAPWEDSNATGVNGDQTNNSATDSGAAYVFVRHGTNWVQQAYLKASNTGNGDGFGYWVAISGNTVVVGAPLEDSNATGVNGNQANNSAPNSGAAYVFVCDGTNWSQQAYIKAANTGGPSAGESFGDNFGISLGVSGDTIVIGAVYEDSDAAGVNGNANSNSAVQSGAAYVFVRNGTNWAQQAYLKASNTGAGDEFGFAVAISGDTVVAGAAGEDSNATGVNGNQNNNSTPNCGAAYVFVRAGTNWIQQAYLKASYAGVDRGFGFSLALSGDGLVVGTPGDASNATGINGDPSNSSAPNSGAAYVFLREGTNWNQRAYLKATNTGGPSPGEFYGDEFGADHMVAISGDTVIVGAHAEDSNSVGVNGNQSDNSAMDSGAAYVFTGFGAETQPTLKPAGKLVAWGNGQFGRTNVPPGDDFVAISTGPDSGHALALRSDGSLVGWGLNYGIAELGSADIFYGQAVSRVGTNFIAIVAGDFFSLAIQVQPPVLTIAQIGTDVVLSWSTIHSGYTLEAKTGLSCSLDWSEVPGSPTIIGDRHTVTNRVSSVNQFYRLKRRHPHLW